MILLHPRPLSLGWATLGPLKGTAASSTRQTMQASEYLITFNGLTGAVYDSTSTRSLRYSSGQLPSVIVNMPAHLQATVFKGKWTRVWVTQFWNTARGYFKTFLWAVEVRFLKRNLSLGLFILGSFSSSSSLPSTGFHPDLSSCLQWPCWTDCTYVCICVYMNACAAFFVNECI